MRRFSVPRHQHTVEANVDESPGEHLLALRLRPRHHRRHSDASVTLVRTSLREWVPVGAAVETASLQADPGFRALVAHNFDFVVPENEMKMQYLQAEQGTFDFTGGDRVVDFAKANGLEFGMGHVLIWHVQTPGWLWLRDPECPWQDENGQVFGSPPWTRSELIEVMRRHITEVVTHYRGSVKEWDVVNEAITDDGQYRRNIWYRVIGPEYVDLAFRFAHQADPGAKLYYNDYRTELAGHPHSDAVYALLRRLVADRVPIDGVGFQLHLAPRSPDYASSDALAMNFRRFADLELQIQVTELDVSTRLLGDPVVRYERQAEVYRNVARACLREPACERFTTWGASDRYSWLPEGSAGLPFDAQLHPKPAWNATTEVLRPTP